MENCTTEVDENNITLRLCEYSYKLNSPIQSSGTGPVLALTIGVSILVILFILSCLIGCISICICYAKKWCCFKRRGYGGHVHDGQQFDQTQTKKQNLVWNQ